MTELSVMFSERAAIYGRGDSEPKNEHNRDMEYLRENLIRYGHHAEKVSSDLEEAARVLAQGGLPYADRR